MKKLLAIAILMIPTFASAEVLCGIDVLKRDNFKQLDGKKIAIITNITGRDKDGKSTIELLRGASNVKVVHLFSPEHGLYANVDEKVGNGVDEKTGLKVFSLYGETRTPTDEMMKGIDAIVYDIQDIGARYYTYPATMAHCMEAAAKHKIDIFVLDRPSPITGNIVDGPLAAKEKLSFTGYFQMPISHGMTVGELAEMFNKELGIDSKLTVVKIDGWKRDMWWDETGLMWVNPSPNMRNPTQSLLYLAVGQIEGANVSVGRGCDQPFEIFGAPWIDGKKLANALNEANQPGLRFTPIEFTPASSKFAKELCHGVYVGVTDRNAVKPVQTGVAIAWTLRKLFGEKFDLKKMSELEKNAETMKGLESAKDWKEIPALWSEDLKKFETLRAKYLLYK